MGIPPDERGELFRRFFRSTITLDRRIPGNGLGLALARVIVERHHGTVTAEHRDPGTAIIVRLPLPGSGPWEGI
jgi:two-component system, OmpR family, phosphate regulon sensor histidine kinase PhoR